MRTRFCGSKRRLFLRIFPETGGKGNAIPRRDSAAERTSHVSNYRPSPIRLILGLVFLCLLFLAWFVSRPERAGLIDRFLLYHVDDVFRYCYIKALAHNPLILLNFSLKFGSALVSGIFYFLAPFGMFSLRLMNVLFACGTLALVYSLAGPLLLSRMSSFAAIILTLTFPVFFLASFSTVSEVMYTFFLLLAVYLVYKKRISASFLAVSFLPLIRQEGLIYCVVWLILFRKRIPVRRSLLVFVPALLWSIANSVILGHRPESFIFYLPGKDPPNSMIAFVDFLGIISVLGFHPAVLFGIAGCILTWKRPEFRFLKICFLSNTVFLLVFQSLHFLDSGGRFFCREIRVLMPLIPMAALMSAAALDFTAAERRRMAKRHLLLGVLAVVSGVIMVVQIVLLQKGPVVVNETVPVAQEQAVREAADWISRYMSGNNIRTLCVVPGGDTTDKIIRRIWMYMPGDVGFYALPGRDALPGSVGREVFDLASMKHLRLSGDTKHVFVSRESLENLHFSEPAKMIPLMILGQPPLYFYEVVYLSAGKTS